jgi:hypothetical protein
MVALTLPVCGSSWRRSVRLSSTTPGSSSLGRTRKCPPSRR